MADTNDINLSDELKRILNDERMTWVQMADFLLQVCNSHMRALPDYQYMTFNQFVEWLAEQLDMKRASLLRFRAVARDYPWLKEKLTEQNIDCPVFPELNPAIGPEGLELLIKLVKFAPQEIWQDSALGVFKQTLRRSELRRRWVATRAVGKGKTGRGLGSILKVKDIDRENQQVKSQHDTVRMYAAFEAMPPEYLGFDKFQRHHIWAFDAPLTLIEGEYPLTFQAALAVQAEGWFCPELHGVFILKYLPSNLLDTQETLVKNRDQRYFVPDRSLLYPENSQASQLDWPFIKVLIDAQSFVDRIWLVVPASNSALVLAEQVRQFGISIAVLTYCEATKSIQKPDRYPANWKVFTPRSTQDNFLRYLLSRTFRLSR